MRILLTGGTGFVGSALARVIADTHDVVVLVRRGSPHTLPSGVCVIHGDLSDPQFTRALPTRLDAIVHLAFASGRFPEDASLQTTVNVSATQQLADHGWRSGIQRFLFASTGNVYMPSIEAMAEDHPLGPTEFYGASKAAAELLLGRYEQVFDVSILRMFAPYGPGQNGRMVQSIASRVARKQGVSLYRGGQPSVNPIYIDDLVDMLAMDLQMPGSRTVNLSGPQVLSVREIAEVAGDVLGVAPSFEVGHGGEERNFIADTALMRSTYKLKGMVDPSEGLRRLLALSAT